MANGDPSITLAENKGKQIIYTWTLCVPVRTQISANGYAVDGLTIRNEGQKVVVLNHTSREK